MNPMNLVAHEPVMTAAVVMAFLSMLVVLNAFSLTVVQLGGINAFLTTVFALVVRSQVTPVKFPNLPGA